MGVRAIAFPWGQCRPWVGWGTSFRPGVLPVADNGTEVEFFGQLALPSWKPAWRRGCSPGRDAAGRDRGRGRQGGPGLARPCPARVAPAPGQRLGGRGSVGTGPATGGRPAQREHGHSRTAQDPGAGSCITARRRQVGRYDGYLLRVLSNQHAIARSVPGRRPTSCMLY